MKILTFTVEEEHKEVLAWDTDFGFCKAVILNGELKYFGFCEKGSTFEWENGISNKNPDFLAKVSEVIKELLEYLNQKKEKK